MSRQRNYSKQIVIRVPDEMLAALEADAENNGRTLAQSVRFLLRTGPYTFTPQRVWVVRPDPNPFPRFKLWRLR